MIKISKQRLDVLLFCWFQNVHRVRLWLFCSFRFSKPSTGPKCSLSVLTKTFERYCDALSSLPSSFVRASHQGPIIYFRCLIKISGGTYVCASVEAVNPQSGRVPTHVYKNNIHRTHVLLCVFGVLGRECIKYVLLHDLSSTPHGSSSEIKNVRDLYHVLLLCAFKSRKYVEAWFFLPLLLPKTIIH